MIFVHPTTGETLETQADFQRAMADIEEQMMPFYRLRRAIREAAAERFEAPLPRRARDRSPTQEKVARCPRCGDFLDKDSRQR